MHPPVRLALAALLASAPCPAQLAASHTVDPALGAPRWGLYFVANHELAVDASSPSPLDHLGDAEIAWVAPRAGGPARKVHADVARRVLLDDVDADTPWWLDWGDLDALEVRRYGYVPDAPSFEDFVISVQEAFAQAKEGGSSDLDGAVDGSLFRVTRDEAGAKALRFFMTEKQILSALGHNELPSTNGVDVDAFTQDADGNLYLSFRTDEIVGDTLVDDAGLVAIPAVAITYDGWLDVAAVEPSSAVVVWDGADADEMVTRAGLVASDGDPIEVLGDLQAVTLDPAGGTFVSREPIPGLGPHAPNLLFAGQSIGASVLSTRHGGSVAELDGVTLASQPIGGGPLGLDAEVTGKTTHDLNALCAVADHRPDACVDADDAWVTLGVEPFVVRACGHDPGEPVAWLMAPDAPSDAPATSTSLPAPSWARYPHVHVLGPLAVLAFADTSGRSSWTAPPPPDDTTIATWIRVQAWGLGSGRLSAPARIWCATP